MTLNLVYECLWIWGHAQLFQPTYQGPRPVTTGMLLLLNPVIWLAPSLLATKGTNFVVYSLSEPQFLGCCEGTAVAPRPQCGRFLGKHLIPYQKLKEKMQADVNICLYTTQSKLPLWIFFCLFFPLLFFFPSTLLISLPKIHSTRIKIGSVTKRRKRKTLYLLHSMPCSFIWLTEPTPV